MATAPNGTSLQQIERLFAEGRTASLPDGELLERFLSEGNEAAFTALVERHGPMVLGTCRAVLRDANAAEDAFQATFLVLICKARSIRGHGALASWLYQVAHRIALQAGAEAALRRTRERRVGEMRVENAPRGELDDAWHEILHEELARLSDKYRLPLMLCELEGKTHAQAALELHCGEATVRRRLAAARDLLRSRLSRRGVTLTDMGLAAAFGRSASSAVPAAWIATTVKMAATFSSRSARVAIGEIVSNTAADLARRSLRAMLLGQLRAGAAVIVFLIAFGGMIWSVGTLGQDRGGAPRMQGPRPDPVGAPAHVATEVEPRATITYRGQVLDPTGRPFSGAAIDLIGRGLLHTDNPPARASSGADGRFHFDVPRSEFDTSLDERPWFYTTIVARAPGFTFGLANDDGNSHEWTLRLARDDAPISGRIIDLEGRPVAGVIVKVLDLATPLDGTLDAWLKAVEGQKEYRGLDDRALFAGRMVFQPNPPLIPPVTTGPDGKFLIDAIGRERVATLQFNGPTIETVQVQVRTRPGPMIRIPPPLPVTIYGATFEHIAGPSRPIEGFVRDKETGRPLAGVIISGPHWNPLGNQSGSFYLHVETITDPHGHYRLTGLPRGREHFILAIPPCDMPYFEQGRLRGQSKADLKVSRDGDLPYLRARIAVDGSHGTGPMRVDFGLKRGVWVSGRVVDRATGQSVRARVEYFVFADNPHLDEAREYREAMFGPHLTGKDGVFHLVAFPGPGVVAALASDTQDRYIRSAGLHGFRHDVNGGALLTYPYVAIGDGYHILTEIDPASGTTELSQDLLLESGRSLKVTVQGPGGRPLSDCLIRGRTDFGDWEEVPSKTSSCAIDGLRPGKAREVTFVNEPLKLTGELKLRGDETEPQVVTLQPWGVLTGRVVDADGEPFRGVELHGYRPARSWFPRLDKDGRFRLEGLVPGKPHELYLFANMQHQGTVVKGVTVRPGEVKDLGDVVPQRTKE